MFLVFQFCYTSVFGAYSCYLFLRTGWLFMLTTFLDIFRCLCASCVNLYVIGQHAIS